MKIAFRSNQLCERGTEVALYDYAHFNEEILGNKSIIISQTNKNNLSSMIALEKFTKRFKVFLYPNENNSEMNRIIRDEKIDILYNIKHGANDGVIGYGVKNCIHCVFDMSEPHGDVYAGVSENLARKFNQKLFVPHVVRSTTSLNNQSCSSEYFRIPKGNIIIGRYGGSTEFDIPFVHNTIYKIVQENDNIYFLFMNTNKFCPEHKQIIHINMSTDHDYKQTFIQTCDAMIHARMAGETFGLSIAEFSVCGKPIITYNGGRDKAHLDMLGEKAILYHDQRSLEDAILNIPDIKLLYDNWNCYDEYNQYKIMRRFEEIFING